MQDIVVSGPGVYVLRDVGVLGPCKIGMATDIYARAAANCGSRNQRPEVLAFRGENDPQRRLLLERQLHWIFGHRRVGRAEWFDLQDDDMVELCRLFEGAVHYGQGRIVPQRIAPHVTMKSKIHERPADRVVAARLAGDNLARLERLAEAMPNGTQAEAFRWLLGDPAVVLLIERRISA